MLHYFNPTFKKKVCLISNQDECEGGGDLTTMLNFALDFKSCLILELTITLVSVIELFMIFPPAFSPIATPVTRRVTMPALLSSLAVAECGEI